MGPRLLVVDDDPAFMGHIEEALGKGFHVEHLGSGNEALLRLQRGGIEAVLIRIELERNQGYQLASAIRKDAALAGVRLALVSSKATPEEFLRHSTLKGRADAYLFADLWPERMAEILLGMMEGHRMDIQDLANQPRLAFQPSKPREPSGEGSGWWTRVFGRWLR